MLIDFGGKDVEMSFHFQQLRTRFLERTQQKQARILKTPSLGGYLRSRI